jgi:hypothetical protein
MNSLSRVGVTPSGRATVVEDGEATQAAGASRAGGYRRWSIGHAWLWGLATYAVLAVFGTAAWAMQTAEPSEQQKKQLKSSFATCMAKIKGPYTENFCVCKDGGKHSVLGPDGRIRSPCGANAKFCAAFRAPCAQVLAKDGMYIGNLFSPDVYTWDQFPDHHDLVRGYILEKYFVETHPEHKLAQLRAYGGLSGAEFESEASTRMFEQYLTLPSFNDSRHFLLAFELQKRFFVRDNQGQIQKARSMATAIQSRDPKFKPLRDATHNQISASLIPKLSAYRDKQPAGQTRTMVDELIEEIRKLTSLDESALTEQIAAISDETIRTRLTALVPAKTAGSVEAIAALGDLMVLARETVAAGKASAADRRRLIDLNITAAGVIQARGAALLDSGQSQTVEQDLRLLAGLTDAAYGVGLITARERDAAAKNLQSLLQTQDHNREEFVRRLGQAERIVEWSQNGAMLAFAEVWPAWTFLLPDVHLIGDDILRGSPLLLFGRAARRLDDHALGKDPIRHHMFGSEMRTGVRALNPGLAMATLRINPALGTYSRNEVLGLPETPAELQPAAGILTQGEGNVVSHVQLLARALGIPNVVVDSEAYAKIKSHDNTQVFFVVTPGGRVYLKEASAMTADDKAIYAEFNRNAKRASDGSLGKGGGKLHIDHARLDVENKELRDLAAVRRSDSGIRSGPKAAYLGELKHLFPDNVARGVVVPFGAYYAHYQEAPVAVPGHLASSGIAQPGTPLPAFVEAAYAEFFDTLIAAGTSEKDLSAWIKPRLEIIQYSIRAAPLAPALKDSIRTNLDQQGLLRSDDKSQTVGCFVRSDTNVEDLDNFNGAGLNLTLFNLSSVEDVYAGVKEVWASPFSYRSFSWRQTLIDEPLWVLPSIVILESVYSEKSGVLVTADIDHGVPGKMLVATSEGVGGAVDGTPAETLLWSPDGVELLTMFKSPTRRLLQPGGGSKLVPSTGSEYVLTPDELKALITAAQKIEADLVPATDSAGNPRPWDIEFGFAKGKLWLFQVRPFVGNDDLKNVPALATLDPPSGEASLRLSLSETVK